MYGWMMDGSGYPRSHPQDERTWPEPGASTCLHAGHPRRCETRLSLLLRGARLHGPGAVLQQSRKHVNVLLSCCPQLLCRCRWSATLTSTPRRIRSRRASSARPSCATWKLLSRLWARRSSAVPPTFWTSRPASTRSASSPGQPSQKGVGLGAHTTSPICVDMPLCWRCASSKARLLVNSFIPWNFGSSRLTGLEEELASKLMNCSCSESMLGGAVGNSISVNVLERCFPSMLKLAKLSVNPVLKADQKDVWRLAVEECFRLMKASNSKASHL